MEGAGVHMQAGKLKGVSHGELGAVAPHVHQKPHHEAMRGQREQRKHVERTRKAAGFKRLVSLAKDVLAFLL